MENYTQEAARIGVPLQFLLDNLAYHHRYGLRKDHFEKAESIRAIIERGDAPHDGDVVRAIGSKTYDRAHLQFTGNSEGTKVSLCVEPTTPYVSEEGDTKASGGYWLGVYAKDLVRDVEKPTEEKFFWTWGDRPRERGNIRFSATVRRWEYTDAAIY